MNGKIFPSILAALVAGLFTAHIVIASDSFGGAKIESNEPPTELIFGDVGRSSTSRPTIILNTDARIATSSQASVTNLTRFFVDTASSTLAAAKFRIVAGQTANFLEFQNATGTLLAYVDPNGSFFTSGTPRFGTSTFNGSLLPALNATYNIGAFGNSWNNIFVSGTVFGGTVSSTMITPYTNNTSDLGVYGNAWRSLYASNSIIIGSQALNLIIGPANDIPFQPTPNNGLDIGGYSFAFRDIYSSGTLFGNQLFIATSSIRSYTDSSGDFLGAGIVAYTPSVHPGASFDSALSGATESSVSPGAATYQPYGLIGSTNFRGQGGSASINVTGIGGFAQVDTSFTGTVSDIRGGLFQAKIDDVVATSVARIDGLVAQIIFDAASAGSVVTTGTGVRGNANFSQASAVTDLIGGAFGSNPTAGGIQRNIGVWGDAGLTKASSSLSGFFTNAPVWIDADTALDVSDHGASNTAGALFVGGLGEFNSNLFVDGRFQASSTALLSLGATSSHIYPWTNNAHDIGAYGAAWRNFYASNSIVIGSQTQNLIIGPANDIPFQPTPNNALDIGGYSFAFRSLYVSTTAFLGSVTSTQHTPWSNNTYDLGNYGAAWHDVYVSGTVTSAGHYPWANNTFDLGTSSTAWRSVVASGTLIVGGRGTTNTIDFRTGGPAATRGNGTCMIWTDAQDGSMRYVSMISGSLTVSTNNCSS